MRLVVRSLLALSLGAAAFACDSGSVTDSRWVAAVLAGTWSEPFSIPGESFVMALTTQDTVVTGQGTFSYEAGPSGRLTVTGLVVRDTVNLDVTFDYGQMMHFRGNLAGLTLLRGMWYPIPVGDPAPVDFKKVR